jgi:hypothetical protein
MPIRTLVFNETSPASAITAVSSLAVAGSDVAVPLGVAGFALDDYDSIDVFASLQGATGGALDVYLQVSPDEGQNWYDAVHWPQITAAHAVVYYRCSLTTKYQTLSDSPTVVGLNGTPALAVNTVCQGMGFDRARLVFVAGASTSAGAKQSVTLACHRMRVREVGSSV